MDPKVEYVQIKNITQSLNRKTLKSSVLELKELLRVYGEDVHLLLLRCLIEEIDLNDQKASKDTSKGQLFVQELQDLSHRPNFDSIICRAFETIATTPDFLQNLSKALKLSLPLQIMISLAMAQSSDKSFQEEGQKHLKARLHEYLETPPSALEHNRIPPPAVHNLLYYVRKTQGVLGKQRGQFLKLLQSLQIGSEPAPSLLPLLDAPELSEGRSELGKHVMSSMSAFLPATRACDLLMDAGYNATSSPQLFRALLSSIPPLTENDVAQAILTMVKHVLGLSKADEATLSHARILSVALLSVTEATPPCRPRCVTEFRPIFKVSRLRCYVARRERRRNGDFVARRYIPLCRFRHVSRA